MTWVRKALRFINFACLLLCVILICGWARSYWRPDRISYVDVATETLAGTQNNHDAWYLDLLSSRGGIGLSYQMTVVGTNKPSRSVGFVPAQDNQYPYCVSRPWAGSIRGYFPIAWVPSTRIYSTNVADLPIMGANPPSSRECLIQGFGFTFAAAGYVSDSRPILVIIPYWALLAVLGLPAALGVRSCIRFVAARPRPKMGYCLVCGYDLRATPERCPECGMVPSESASNV